MILCPFEKISFSVYVFGEDQETLRSAIYSLAELPNTNIAYVNFSNPPLHPKTFPINIYLKKETSRLVVENVANATAIIRVSVLAAQR